MVALPDTGPCLRSAARLLLVAVPVTILCQRAVAGTIDTLFQSLTVAKLCVILLLGKLWSRLNVYTARRSEISGAGYPACQCDRGEREVREVYC